MNDNIFAFSATETGYNHTKIQKVCEDASDYYDDEKMHICVVADGHGSDNYPRTDRGAKYAVDAAISCIIEFVRNADPEQVIDDERCDFGLLLQLAKSILNNWHQSVSDDYNRHPFVEEELEKVSEKYKRLYLSEKVENRRVEKAYGCTLIAYVVTADYSFGLQIGDGKCVVVDRYGNFIEPIPWDENCQLNVTTSICDGDSIEEFRFSVSDQIPTAVFCGSDGIDDSYANPEELYALYRSILLIFIEHGVKVGQNEIKEYLPVLTKKGSGDDVSIGVIINIDHAIEIAPLMEIQARIFTLSTKLTEKKHRLETNSEKKQSLLNKLQNLIGMGKNISDTANSIDQLTSESHQLKKEISSLEKEIYELSRREQELVYDSQVASFDERIQDNSATDSEEHSLEDEFDGNNRAVVDTQVFEREGDISNQPETVKVDDRHKENLFAAKDESKAISATVSISENQFAENLSMEDTSEQCIMPAKIEELELVTKISKVSEEKDNETIGASVLETEISVVDKNAIVESHDEVMTENAAISKVPATENSD